MVACENERVRREMTCENERVRREVACENERVRREMACENERLQREVGELKSANDRLMKQRGAAIAAAGAKRRPALR